MFHLIDRDKWPREEVYRHYTEQVPCTYSMCVELKISRLKEETEKAGLKFFPVFLYGLCLAVNNQSAFRMGKNQQGEPGCYDMVSPSYTVFDPATESFSVVWTEFNRDFPTFYQSYLSDSQLAGKKPNPPGNLFDVSCIPWASFTGFHLNIGGGYDYLPPIFTVGKYFYRCSELCLPLAIQVHHGVCDGFHVARLVNDLQEWADNFSPQLSEK